MWTENPHPDASTTLLPKSDPAVNWRLFISYMNMPPTPFSFLGRHDTPPFTSGDAGLKKHLPLNISSRLSRLPVRVYDGWSSVEVLMFTGIVEEVGRVTRIEQRGENRRITIAATTAPKELKPGDSVAVSGVCLTALDIKAGSFCADLAPETWVRTSFSRMHEGALVNLELSMKADGRFGGHIVQGHVDGVGKLIGLERIADSENWWLRIELPLEVGKYTVYKGSICIEGISLTVATIDGSDCTVAIIPHTVEMTNLNSLQPGDPVNLEADLIAKYVEKMMSNEKSESSLSVEELVRQGF
jgi:riboflavin synthase